MIDSEIEAIEYVLARASHWLEHGDTPAFMVELAPDDSKVVAWDALSEVLPGTLATMVHLKSRVRVIVVAFPRPMAP